MAYSTWNDWNTFHLAKCYPKRHFYIKNADVNVHVFGSGQNSWFDEEIDLISAWKYVIDPFYGFKHEWDNLNPPLEVGPLNALFTSTYATKEDPFFIMGVSTYDIHLIRKHLLNIQTLDSHRLLAADVNNSEKCYHDRYIYD